MDATQVYTRLCMTLPSDESEPTKHYLCIPVLYVCAFCQSVNMHVFIMADCDTLFAVLYGGFSLVHYMVIAAGTVHVCITG